jgi:hypothetical protein
MELERRGCIVQPKSQANWNREEPASAAKPFSIPKREVWHTAEGVETNEQLAILRVEGCNEVQGYLFNRPRPAAEVESMFSSVQSDSWEPPTATRRGVGSVKSPPSGDRLCSRRADELI